MNKVCLVIMDGFGVAPNWGGNAITLAKMPVWKRLWQDLPHSLLVAHGQTVGLPGNEIGNSEVGHLTIGAGRIVPQDSTRINELITSGEFYKNEQLVKTFSQAKKDNTPVHLMGLMTDAPVHASLHHLEALLYLAHSIGVDNLYLHLFSDGRDTPTESGMHLFKRLEATMDKLKVGKIASIAGRYYAMDRDNRWDRTKKTVDCLTRGVGNQTNSPLLAFATNYGHNLSDEFLLPTLIVDDNQKPIKLIENGEPIIFFNFRSDRVRQTSEMLLSELPSTKMFTFIPYKEPAHQEGSHMIPLFKPERIENGLAKWLSDQGIKQYHIGETEKYAHITYFLNSGYETPFPGEDREIISSPKVATYDLKPEMSAGRITNELIKKMKDKKTPFLVANYANPDMVGHTGKIEAATKTLEFIDLQIEKLIKTSYANDYFVIITADHGNVEEMVDPMSGAINPDHTKNPVPFIIIPPKNHCAQMLKPKGTLADIAPTILSLMEVSVPAEMTGNNLLV